MECVRKRVYVRVSSASHGRRPDICLQNTDDFLLLLVQRHHSVTSTQQTRVSLLYDTQNYDVTHSVCDSNVNKSSIEETATNASAILTSFSHTYRDYVGDVIELAYIYFIVSLMRFN